METNWAVEPSVLTYAGEKEEVMKKMGYCLLVIMFAFSLAISLACHSSAKEKNPVRFKVINTFKPDFAEIKKAQLVRFEMDPGAEVKNFKLPCSEILWVTKGSFTYKYGDKVVTRKTGESWFHSEGMLFDVSNKGKGVAILRGIQFYRTE
jgi:hypothetical protein